MGKSARIVLYAVAFAVIVFWSEIIDLLSSASPCMREHFDSQVLLLITNLIAIITLIELLAWCNVKEKANKHLGLKKQVDDVFLYDAPTEIDTLGRFRPAKLLADKIIDTFCIHTFDKGQIESSFVIHLCERYGMGKTSFLMLLHKAFEECKCDYVFVEFKAWLCDSDQSILTEFFNQFRENIKGVVPDVDDSIMDYLRLLLSSTTVRRTVGLSSISINGDKLIRHKKGTLKDIHDKICKSMLKATCPIVVTIDDVDRLRDEEFSMVLKIIRDTADFPNVFYIVAADNDYLKDALTRLGVEDAGKYLEKFFNLEYYLPANEDVPFNTLLKELERLYEFDGMNECDRSIMLTKIASVGQISNAFLNMRQVKRFINSYILYLDLIRASNNADLDPFEMFLLCLIKHLNADIYIRLRDDLDSLLTVKSINGYSDEILVLKENLNIKRLRDYKHFQESNEDYVKEEKRKKGEHVPVEKTETVIPKFTQVIADTEYDTSETVISALDLMFGNDQKVGVNDIRRVNKYYTYFCGEQASYMLTRLELLSLLSKPMKDYEAQLDDIFKQKCRKHSKYQSFLGEFSHYAQIVSEGESELLKRFFAFIARAYKNKIDFREFGYSSLTEYMRINFEQQVLGIFFGIYAANKRYHDNNDETRIKNDFFELCHNYERIGFLIFILTRLYGQAYNLIFSNDDIKDVIAILRERLMSECVKATKGFVSQDTIFCLWLLRSDIMLRDMLLKYLETDEDACMNLLCLLIKQYPKGNCDWNLNLHEALFKVGGLFNTSVLTTLAATHSEYSVFINDLSQLLESNSSDSITNNLTGQFVSFALVRQAHRKE